MMNEATVTQTAQTLMRAVVATGAVRAQDADLACKVMREELKAFLFGDKYADERALTLTGQGGLAMASLAATCAQRIIAERA